MSEGASARRVIAHVEINGVDISTDIKPYLQSMSYTDNEEDKADDLQIKLQDRDDIWLTQWLPPIATAAEDSEPSSDSVQVGDIVQFLGGPHYISSTAERPENSPNPGPATLTIVKDGAPHPYHVIHTDSQSRVYGWVNADQIAPLDSGTESSAGSTSDSKLKIRASIELQHWENQSNSKLDFGSFELDGLSGDGPPSTITIKATALPYSSTIRQTKKSKAWESYTLSGIANEMASNSGLSCEYLAKTDPKYERKEQNRESDISFLSSLCHDSGFSLKVTDDKLVIFDQAEYEQKEPVATIAKGDGQYSKYRLGMEDAETQYESCRVSYTDSSGSLIEGIAKVADFNEKSNTNQQLEIYAPVSSAEEAKELAAKQLRRYNKARQTIRLTTTNIWLSGVTIQFDDSWGYWSGKYLVKQSRITIDTSGLSSQLTCRKILEGY